VGAARTILAAGRVEHATPAPALLEARLARERFFAYGRQAVPVLRVPGVVSRKL
jgi:hypothetical protein